MTELLPVVETQEFKIFLRNLNINPDTVNRAEHLSGSFSDIYIAETNDGDRVALKVLKGTSPENAESEFEVLKQFKDVPEIISCLGFFRHTENSVFVFPLCHGGNLREALGQRALTVGEIAAIIKRIGKGVIECHQRGIAHRDIKLQNVLLQEAGDFESAVLGDFGICTAIKGLDTDKVIGTLTHMSPYALYNLIAESEEFLKEDQYAFAIMVYQLIAGDPGKFPFGNIHRELGSTNNNQELVERIIEYRKIVENPQANYIPLQGLVSANFDQSFLHKIDKVLMTALNINANFRHYDFAKFISELLKVFKAASSDQLSQGIKKTFVPDDDYDDGRSDDSNGTVIVDMGKNK